MYSEDDIAPWRSEWTQYLTVICKVFIPSLMNITSLFESSTIDLNMI